MPVEEPKETPPSPPPPVVDEAPPPAPPPSLLPTPTITSGRFKADMTKYSFKQAPGKVKGQPKLTKPDLSPFEGAVPTLSSSSLLASPPKPVVFTPIRLASHSSAINYIISQINSGDQEACVQALKQVSHTLTEKEAGQGVEHINNWGWRRWRCLLGLLNWQWLVSSIEHNSLVTLSVTVS